MSVQRRFTLIAALCASLTLVACGGGDTSAATSEEGVSVKSANPSESASNTKPKPANSVSGRFGATPGNGYTVKVSYNLSNIEGQVNIADAEPGQAIVYGAAAGDMAVTNTTPQRNTKVKLPQFEAELLWDKSQVRGDLLSNLIEPEDVCDFSFRGASYCNLVNLDFELVSPPDYAHNDPTTLGPSQSLNSSVAATKIPDIGRPGIHGLLVVRESDADKLSGFVSSTRPDLIAIYGGTGGADELRMSCVTQGLGEEDYRPERGPLGILSGRGRVLIEGGEVAQYENYPLTCADA